ncbi:MAG: hypothetical protein JJT87_12595 [Halomonas sp.]|nr:hypothetical protein [Halomonas sp.]MCC5902749.1 hypothetical protein [Halomonas sp.]
MDWRNIRKLLEELGDPFVMMPISSAAASLNQSLLECNESFQEHMGPYGVARKFWSVPCELIYEEIGFVIGNAFVLAQVAVSQAVSICIKLKECCVDLERLPKSKLGFLKSQTGFIGDTDISKIEAINAIANYFKHYHEWPEGWIEQQAKKTQKNTILTVKKLGFSEGELTDNMVRSLSLLGIYGTDLGKLCHIVSDWRESLPRLFETDSNFSRFL